MTSFLFNADDYGISRNISDCIYDLAKKNYIHSTSIFSNTKYFDNIKSSLNNIQIEKGLHFSLTEGKCLSNSRDLVDESGYLKFSGKDLFWMYLTGKLNNDLLNQIYDEFHSQFDLLSKYCEIQHISSHEHVHMIPPIFDYLFNFSKSKKINLRYFNEDFFTFYNFNDLNNFIYDLNFLKFFLISFLSKFSNKYELNSYKSYGIKFSGKINYINLAKYFKSLNFSEKVYIYFHPGYKSITEEKNLNLKKYDYKFINSFDRQKELNSIIDFYNKN